MIKRLFDIIFSFFGLILVSFTDWLKKTKERI